MHPTPNIFIGFYEAPNDMANTIARTESTEYIEEYARAIYSEKCGDIRAYRMYYGTKSGLKPFMEDNGSTVTEPEIVEEAYFFVLALGIHLDSWNKYYAPYVIACYDAQETGADMPSFKEYEIPKE
ncbi:hypothetical protein GGH95_003427 [Coemansia sp. RSA 1836]|nr:hypothetical protein GGH95_003427 [Coemansia sp. RSA 1836]